MTDISKCHGENCDKKERCYRFTAPFTNLQSMIAPDPKDCEMFWPTDSWISNATDDQLIEATEIDKKWPY